MKRNIYKNKIMQKIIATVLLLILMLNLMMPITVSAAEEGEMKLFEDWIAFIENEDITDKKKEKIKKDLKSDVIQMMLQTGILGPSHGIDFDEDEAAEVYFSKPGVVYVRAIPKRAAFTNKLKSIKVVSFGIADSGGGNEDGNESSDFVFKKTYKYQELLDWTGKTKKELDDEIIPKIQYFFNIDPDSNYGDGVTAETVAKDILEANRETILLTVLGTKSHYTIIKVEIRKTYKYQELLDWTGKTKKELDDEIIPKIQYFYNIDPDSKYYNIDPDRNNGESVTAETVAEYILEANRETILLTVSGIKYNYEIINIEIPEKDVNKVLQEAYDALGIKKEDDLSSADAGGMLLNLVVPLVNFVADAIVASVGSIMNGDGLSFGMGILVPKEERWEVPADVTKFMDVDTHSFAVGGIQYPNITYTPEEIFAGSIDLLSIDFISGKNYEGVQNTDSNWKSIRAVISQWYQVLRLIAIIGLLSVLIYTGIKIIISANAKDKAKYKEWIMDWFMAVAILFSMHFIMAFIVAVTGEFSALITEVSKKIYVRPIGGEGEPFATNLMGLVRFMVQSDNFYMKVGYEVMYIALIVYTIKFTFVYLKRVLNMAFLTLIAPIVALTYPIDKINDGKAQGFDMWLKEYTFNALLQPMHCILYYVLVGSAVSIAASNPIYGIVVLAFMTEAEKLLKSIFGFSKANAGTVGGVGSAFAAGAIASNLAKLAKLPKGNAGKGGNGGAGGDDKALDAPKPTDKPGMDAFNDEPQGSVEERMQEADDEKFGTDEYDSSEREANLRNSNTPTQGSMYDDMSDDEYREYLRDNMGMDDETVEAAMAARNGEQSTGENQQDSGQSNGDSGKPIRQMAFVKGAKAVGKKLLKPAWDLDKSKSYNFKRLGKGALKTTAKALGGFALGATAAAVQAGISITDGKYNPMEGIAALSAGAAGAGRIVDGIGGGIGSMIDTYRDGANAGDKKAQMERAKARFGDRDDVIAFNKKNYPGQEETAMERQRDNYLTAGVTDLKEMKSGMKYADTLVGKTDGLSAEQLKERRAAADRKAAATIDFKKSLKEQGQLEAIRNSSKQKEYIETMVARAADADKAKVRKQYENAFKSVVAFDAANS